MAELTTLVEDVLNVLRPDNNHTVAEDNVQRAGELFKEVLRTRLTHREPVKGQGVIRFSSLGKKDRQLWYAANMPEKAEILPSTTILKFLYGDLIEILLLFLVEEAGHEVSRTQEEVSVDGVKGHIDAVIDGVVVDVKSASSYSFAKFKDGSFTFDDPFGYIPQLSGYANVLGKTDDAAFLVADKVNGGVTLAHLDKLTIEGNPPAPRIAHLKEVVAQPMPPSKCYSDVTEGKSGNRKLAMGCSYCAYKDECWKDSNGGQGLRQFFYSRGPVWLTEVKREPKVGESVA